MNSPFSRSTLMNRSPPPVSRHFEPEPTSGPASGPAPITSAPTVDAVSTHQIQKWMAQIEQFLNDICTISGDGKLDTEQKLKLEILAGQCSELSPNWLYNTSQ